MSDRPPHGMVRLRDDVSGVTAVVSPRGAALRALSVDGRDLIEPLTAHRRAPGMAGVVLAPWPNRVEDALWHLKGQPQQLAITEPELGHANHGLVAKEEFGTLDQDDSSIVLSHPIRHPPGYPFDLDVQVAYTLEPTGVTATVSIKNVGIEGAPVALGTHPYLRLGAIPTAELALTIDATHAYRLDGRHIPRERFPVSGTRWDLRAPVMIAEIPPHATFVNTVVERGSVHSVRHRSGARVELWTDQNYRWTQLYVSNDFPAETGPRTAVAVEPMTAPPNALRTGEGVKWLEPRDWWHTSWGLRLVAP